jgi:hypothetical protein
VLAPGVRPAGNWLSATIPYFADADVAAVVAPTVAPLRGPLRERVAAAVLESRLGSGSRRLGYLPGNVRDVTDHPADSVVIRSADYSSARAAHVDSEHLVAWLAERGRRTIYTPETSISAPPAPLVAPHLAGTFRHARARGSAARRSGGTSLSLATALSLLPLAAALVGFSFLLAGDGLRDTGLVLLLAYAAALAVSGIHAAVRFHSAGVGLLQPFAVIASQVTYLVGFVRGLSERSRLP